MNNEYPPFRVAGTLDKSLVWLDFVSKSDIHLNVFQKNVNNIIFLVSLNELPNVLWCKMHQTPDHLHSFVQKYTNTGGNASLTRHFKKIAKKIAPPQQKQTKISNYWMHDFAVATSSTGFNLF